MKCLETRKRDGMKWRRYRTEDGRIVTTFEIPTAVLGVVSMKRLQAQIGAFNRGEETRARGVLIRNRIAEGIKPTAIAHEFGITDQRVRQIRGEMEAQA